MPTIVPFDLISTTTITSFDIDGIDIQLFSSAKVRVNLFNSQRHRVDIRYVSIAGDDYTNWGNDDQYIITFVSNALGFVAPIDDPVLDPVIDPVLEPVIDPVLEPVIDPAVI